MAFLKRTIPAVMAGRIRLAKKRDENCRTLEKIASSAIMTPRFEMPWRWIWPGLFHNTVLHLPANVAELGIAWDLGDQHDQQRYIPALFPDLCPHHIEDLDRAGGIQVG